MAATNPALPYLSQYDPIEVAEGSIDPLGLSAGYEQLADVVLPGLTVRMGRPRFLTLLALGALIAREFEPDALAADGITPPYIVFEWWLIQAFHIEQKQLADSGRIPGLQKVGNSVRTRCNVNANGYLAVPSVFGFTGIFRRLAVKARIVTPQGTLENEGFRILETWSKEQGLEGLVSSAQGAGADFRRELTKALRDGLSTGSTSPRSKDFWQRIAQHLDPSKPGKRERKVLAEVIQAYCGNADEVAHISQALVSRHDAIERSDEARFIRSLMRGAPPALRHALQAIDDYESVCRPLTQAFDWLRYLASQSPAQGVDAKLFGESAPVAKLQAALEAGLKRVADNQLVADKWKERCEALQRFSDIRTPQKFFDAIIQQHTETQRRKPPEPKRAWLEQAPGGRWLIRAAYRVDEAPSNADVYVHDYRLPTFSRMLRDLGALS